MARQTRAQRRARRQKQAESRPAQPEPRARPLPQPVRAQAHEAVGETAARHVPRKGTRFVSESWAELKKVEWPGQSQLIQATTVVLLACAIVGVYLWGADLVLKRLVEKVFLGQ